MRTIAGSDRVAALSSLLFAFQSRMMEVWFRTAVVYDLLAFTFFYAAALLYIARKNSVFIVLCYICALDSKEIAVALPVVLLVYELLFESFEWKRLRLIAFLAAITIPYVLSRTRGANAITNNPAYRPEYSFARFAHSWSTFLNYIFVQNDGRIGPSMSIAILAAMLLVAFAFHSRRLIFAWALLFIATLPVAFLSYRGAFVLYVSWPGWTMYAALVLVAAQDWMTRSHPQYRTALACAVFLLAGWRWGKINLHDQRADPRHWLYDPEEMVRNMASQMSALYPKMPRGASMLFLEDAFSTDEWTPYFVVKLLYRDDTMTVDRVKMMSVKPADWSRYQYVFDYREGKYAAVKYPGNQ